MKRLFKAVVAAALLPATALLLLADDQGPCNHAAESATFRAQSTCGTSGAITLQSPKDTCDLNVDGAAAVGLPSHGKRSDYAPVSTGIFTLSGDVVDITRPDAGEDGGAPMVHRDCTFVAADGGSAFSCTGGLPCDGILTP